MEWTKEYVDTLTVEETEDYIQEMVDTGIPIIQSPFYNNITLDLLEKINNGVKINDFDYQDSDLFEEYFTIDKMYEVTNGNISYKDAVNYFNKSFYLVKSKLRARNSIINLKNILNDDKYNSIYTYMLNHTYGIEPKVTTRII